MAEKLRIFVSATKDLDGERAIIGRALAELPVEIGAEIRRTPAEGASYDDIFELIANVDRVYFLMGSDITAPSGAEWQLAWKLERDVLPLRKPARLTPAAQDFVRPPLIEWKWFHTRRELWQIVTQDLVRILNNPKNRYGLSVTELELLALHGKRLRPREAAPVRVPGGAEGGGVLLDSGHEVFDDNLLLEE
jgi:hypothetical protein